MDSCGEGALTIVEEAQRQTVESCDEIPFTISEESQEQTNNSQETNGVVSDAVPEVVEKKVFIGKTFEEDMNAFHSAYDNQLHADRRLRVTVGMNNSNFVQFKLFKWNHNDSIWRVHQQVSLTLSEFDKVLLQMEPLRDEIKEFISGPLPSKPLKFVGGRCSPSTDVTQTHWFKEVHHTQRRLVRVSVVVYDLCQPLVSSYVQIKLFTRANENAEFERDRIVSFTFREFCDMAEKQNFIERNCKRICFNFVDDFR